MTTHLTDREKTFEKKFSYDDHLDFKIRAKRDKLIALWAAEKIHVSAEDVSSYVSDVIDASLQEKGDNDIMEKILHDFSKAGIPLDIHELKREMSRCLELARAKSHHDS